MNKEEHFNLPKIDKFDESFKEKKFDKEKALFLIGEIQRHWCEGCDNYKDNDCGCYLPPFKKEMIRKINEHFDNPPLEFEELTFSQPYWYEEEKCWCFLTSINKDIKTGVGILLEGRFPTMKAINFKEDHFYAREVNE